MPTGGVLLRGTVPTFFTFVIADLAETGTASSIFEMKVLIVGKDCAQKWPNCACLDKTTILGLFIV